MRREDQQHRGCRESNEDPGGPLVSAVRTGLGTAVNRCRSLWEQKPGGRGWSPERKVRR